MTFAPVAPPVAEWGIPRASPDRPMAPWFWFITALVPMVASQLVRIHLAAPAAWIFCASAGGFGLRGAGAVSGWYWRLGGGWLRFGGFALGHRGVALAAAGTLAEGGSACGRPISLLRACNWAASAQGRSCSFISRELRGREH